MPLVYAGLCSHAAAGAGRGTVHSYAPIPIFAVGCTIADIDVD